MPRKIILTNLLIPLDVIPKWNFPKTQKTAHSCHNKEKLIDLKDKKKRQGHF